MQRIRPYDPFLFLTPPRIHAIESGVLSFNRDHQSITQDRLHLLQHMNAWHKGIGTRPWLVAHILEALSDDEHAENCCFGNMQGILFDLAYFFRFFKLHHAINQSCIGAQRLGRESETFRKAHTLPSPRLLFPLDAIDEGMIPPLAELYLGDIGYFMRRRNVVELYFLYQDSHKIKAMRPLGLLSDDFVTSSEASA